MTLHVNTVGRPCVMDNTEKFRYDECHRDGRLFFIYSFLFYSFYFFYSFMYFYFLACFVNSKLQDGRVISNGYNMVVLQFRMDQAGGTMRRIMNENSSVCPR